MQSVDDPCTVFLITERDRTHVLDYNYDFFHGGGATGVKGYRTDLVVCVVDLPSRQPRGRYRISGDGPPNVVELKPNRKEVDEDWAGNLKEFIEDCVHGPEKQYVPKHNQPLHLQADAARERLGECELLGSLPTLGRFPRQATIYNLQTDRLHPANALLRTKADQSAESRLLVLPLEERLVLDPQNRFGKVHWRVALFAFPGADPLGVYYLQGESWPTPRKPGETWADDPTTNKSIKNPHQALAHWVDEVCKVKGGMPRGTLAVSADAELLAGTEWLEGPGWLKRAKRAALPKDQQGWEKMAEECSSNMKACRALGPAAPPASLPKKVVVWVDHSENFVPSMAQQMLPRSLQAGATDSSVIVAMIVEQHFVQLPKDTRKPTKERWDYDLALFTMPGARPVGTYRVEGDTLPVDRPRVGRNSLHHDVNQDVATWLEKFMDDPQDVARQ